MTYLPSLVRFGIAGSASLLLNLITTAFLHEILTWTETVAYGVSLISVSVPMFVLCRYFVFESHEQAFWQQLIKFYSSWVVFRIFEYLAFIFILKWAGVFYIFAIIGAQAAFVFAKFIFWRRNVFVIQSI